MVVDAVLVEDVEPVLRSPAEGLSLVGNHGWDDLVENGDVVGVRELEGIVVDGVDLFDLPGHYFLHAALISSHIIIFD